MKHARNIIIGLVMVLSSEAAAQQGQPGAHFIENWDLNGDGQITPDEAREKRGDLFIMFDQDENGQLDAAEYALFDATRQADMDANAGGHQKGAMANVNAGLVQPFNDTDGDGLVSEKEFLDRSAEWFKMMDSTKDGAVTTDDFAHRDG